MKYVELSQHIHELRAAGTGRAIGRGMRLAEVWSAVHASPKTDITAVQYFETDLPEPIDGLFVRLQSNDGDSRAAVYVEETLEPHWKEFVAIKELMHCWSPTHTWQGTPDSTKMLVRSLTSKEGRYTPSAMADINAVTAAAEVILPHKTVERHIALEHDTTEIAHQHGLHPDVVEMICQYDLLQKRKNGSLGAD